MKDIKDFIKIGEDGKVVIDYDAYNADLNAELDRARTQASTTATANTEKKLRDNLEKEIRQQLEDEAKMTAEEKLKSEREAFIREKQEFDKERIRQTYANAGIEEDEIAILLGFVGDDSKTNLETAQKIADARKKSSENARAKILEELQTSYNSAPNGNGAGASATESVAEKMAKKYSAKPVGDYVDLNSRHDGVDINDKQ